MGQPQWRTTLSLGKVSNWRRGVALYRAEPFWMRPKRFSHIDEIPRDTQLLLVELRDGRYLLLAPLVQDPLRSSVFGREGQLWATLDSGDPSVVADSALVAYVGEGPDLFAVMADGARAVAERLGIALVQPEPTASLARSWADCFGWCTWEAFGPQISQTGLEQGLASLRQAGVPARFVILDDGWQPVTVAPSGEQRLAGLGANSKFPNGVAGAVRAAKDTYGAEWAFVWHTAHGYWGGCDDALPFDVSDRTRWYSPEVLSHQPTANVDPWGAVVGVPEETELFYAQYHAELAAAGVDGVKVDNQASIEALSQGDGGRVHAARTLRATIDSSAARHFDGRVLHCMSCSTDLLYAGGRGFTRSSADYAPDHVHSHALHLDTNALVGLWFGHFARCDWDMFLSRHPAATLHAAARAVSGGPIYVADAPGQHDPALLQTLVLPDGGVLRAQHAGRPTLDSVFDDPNAGRHFYKVWNQNATTHVLGLFNLTTSGGPRRGTFKVADVPDLHGDEFAVFLQRAKVLKRVARHQLLDVSLPPLGAEVVSIARLDAGCAALGLSDYANAGAAVLRQGWVGNTFEVELRFGGEFVACSTRTLRELQVDGRTHVFTQNAEFVSASVPRAERCTLALLF